MLSGRSASRSGPGADMSGSTHAEAGDEFSYRPLTAADRDEVLALTANTWEHGDYIGNVYDVWLTDSTGRFIAVVETSTGRIAAIDKLSFDAPREAWFEGLRVSPDFRGRGLATKTQQHMIEVARELGARTIRFVTNANNRPIHRMAYRDGFRLRMVTRFWSWKRASGEQAVAATPGEPMDLRAARVVEAPQLHDWWVRGSAYATYGLVHTTWRFVSTSTKDWEQAASNGTLFVESGYKAGTASTVPGIALLEKPAYRPEGKTWSVAALAAEPGRMAPLVHGLLSAARENDVEEVLGIFPEVVELRHALESTQFEPDSEDERLCLFELLLD